MIEKLSAAVHDAWWKEKKIQGFHSPIDCESQSAKDCHEHDIKSVGLHPFLKFHKYCDKCHTDMYPYEELPENVKEYDRVTVRSALTAIDNVWGKKKMECIQFTGNNNTECVSFIGSKFDDTKSYPNIITPQGVVEITVGSLIVKEGGDIYKANIELPKKEVIPEYQQRVITEHTELDDKCTKLWAYTHTSDFKKLEHEEQVRMIKQLGFMQSYRQVLMERIEEF